MMILADKGKFVRGLVPLMLIICGIPSLTACRQTDLRKYTQPTSATVQTSAHIATETDIPTTEAAIVETTERLEHIHHYTAVVTGATCTEDGYTIHTCACGDFYTDTPVEALGHTYEAKTVEATCAERGYTTHTCTCGDTYQDNYVSAHGHQWGEWEITKEPTVSATGEAERKCAVCGSAETRTLPKEIDDHIHQYDETITKEANCSAEGTKTFTCSCGNRYTESIAKTDHKYSNVVTDPTCNKEGYTTYTCDDCGHSYEGDLVAALCHDFVNTVATKASCTTGERLYRTCTRCGIVFGADGAPALGHSYVVIDNTARCTKDGEIIEQCERCTDIRRTPSPAKGHGETFIKKEKGNCVIDGYEHVVCTVCDEILSTITISAVGAHDYEKATLAEASIRYWEAYNDSYYVKYCNYYDWTTNICKRCDDIDADTIQFAYSDYEAALIMLGYVNELRESVYGTDEYNLELDPNLLALAKARAEEISTNFCHVGLPYGENICGGSPNIYSQYMQWYNSPGHYQNMIRKNYKYFCYAMYVESFGMMGYGVQLFSF